MYRYQGAGRLQLWFASPNVCATFLVIAILLALALFLWCAEHKKWHGYLGASGVGFLIVILELMLGATYSRGGFIGLGIGFLFFWLLTRRHAVWIFGLAEIAAILLAENGSDRIQSIGQIVSDASIGNRILLWRGAAGIINRYWESGVAQAGEIYRTWYQPLWLKEYYRTMINDYLTLGVQYGVGALWLYWVVFLSPLWLLWRYIGYFGGWKVIGAGLGSAIAAYLACASFSTMYEHAPLEWLTPLLCGLTLSAVIVACIRAKIWPRWFDYGMPLLGATVIAGIVLLWGEIENQRLKYDWQVDESEQGVTELWPRRTEQPIATVVLLESEENFLVRGGETVRHWGRPLALEGYRVILEAVDADLDGRDEAIRVLNWALREYPEQPVILVGVHNGAQQALLAAVQAEAGQGQWLGIVAWQPEATYSREERSPLEMLDRIPGTVVLLHSATEAEDMEILARRRREAGQSVTVMTVDDQEGAPVAAVLAAIRHLTDSSLQQKLEE